MRIISYNCIIVNKKAKLKYFNCKLNERKSMYRSKDTVVKQYAFLACAMDS